MLCIIGPKYSQLPHKPAPRLRRQGSVRDLTPYLDPYHKTKKWLVASDLLSAFHVYCIHISDQGKERTN
jgi:hypothetical protein